MMGLFKRKDAKHQATHEKDEHDSVVSSSSARTSNASLKLPMSMRSSNSLSTTIPEVPMAPPPDPNLDPAAYLRSIHAVRQRCRVIMLKARNNQLNHFDVDWSKFKFTAQSVVAIIKVRVLSMYLFCAVRS